MARAPDLLNGIGDAAFAIDVAGQIAGWNAAAEGLLGLKDRETIGRRCHEVLDCRDLQGTALCSPVCPFLQAISSKTPLPSVDFLTRHRSGSVIQVTGSLILLNADPKVQALILLRPSVGGVVDECYVFTPQLALGTAGTRNDANGHGNGHKNGHGNGNVNGNVNGNGNGNGHGLGVDLAGTLDRLLIATGADAAELFLASPVEGPLVLAAHRGRAPRAFRQITQFDRGQGFPGLVVATGEPILSVDLPHDERYMRTQVKRQGFRSYLCVPIRGNHDILGSLHIASKQDVGAFVTKLPFLTRVARRLGAMLDLYRLSAAEFLATQPLDPNVDAAANLRQVADQALQTLTSTAEADCGVLLLTDEPSARLQPVSEWGVSPRLHHTLARACNHNACPAVAQQRCVLPADAAWAELPSCHAVQRDLATALCLPLHIGNRTYGVALLGWRRHESLPTSHLTYLHALIDRAATTIHNAQVALHEENEARERTLQNRLFNTAATAAPHAGAPSSAAAGAANGVPLLDLRCLGQVAIFRNGLPVPLERFARRRSLTLLKILLTRYGKQVHREELMEILWPEADLGSASDLLHVVVHYLRRGLEPDALAGQPSRFIRTNGDYYAFDTQSPHRLDSQEFLTAVKLGAEREAQGQQMVAIQACERAISLYTGDFLEDELYSDWCALEREYLRENFLTTLRRAARLHLGRGNLEAAVACYRRALLTDATLEDVHRDLMKALWRSGHRDEALRQYRECRAVLERELGVAPLPETEALRQQIANDDGKVLVGVTA